jgi:hypothetical protein
MVFERRCSRNRARTNDEGIQRIRLRQMLPPEWRPSGHQCPNRGSPFDDTRGGRLPWESIPLPSPSSLRLRSMRPYVTRKHTAASMRHAHPAHSQRCMILSSLTTPCIGESNSVHCSGGACDAHIMDELGQADRRTGQPDGSTIRPLLIPAGPTGPPTARPSHSFQRRDAFSTVEPVHAVPARTGGQEAVSAIATARETYQCEMGGCRCGAMGLKRIACCKAGSRRRRAYESHWKCLNIVKVNRSNSTE